MRYLKTFNNLVKDISYGTQPCMYLILKGGGVHTPLCFVTTCDTGVI